MGPETYASDVVAVSMTGWGEKIMRAVSGHTVSSYMKFKPASLEEAGKLHCEVILMNPGSGDVVCCREGDGMFSWI
ncbi:MAG: isoaspartyl peptidase/L-asparaginase [Balneolaceae bacterium]|nr:isoaspartyl peptidase/L-asparaginase [Balneolaceae bacterium]